MVAVGKFGYVLDFTRTTVEYPRMTADANDLTYFPKHRQILVYKTGHPSKN